jgi:6-phosphogluconolactonase
MARRAKGTLTIMMERAVPGDGDEAAAYAAGAIAADLIAALDARPRASLALSGGRSPWVMMADLFARDLPWTRVDLLQVDERVAPDGDERRNLTRIRHLLEGSPAQAAHLHPMRVVEGARAAVRDYARVLGELGGPIDVIQLGLGEDGHTASLAPGDPVLDVHDTLVAATARPFNGTERVTLTYPALDAARQVVWLVTGKSKREMAARLQAGDPSIPAGRVRAADQLLVLDREAAGD